MVYTVTCNAALDYVVRAENFKPGTLCRAGEETLRAGGKGLNVSVMLETLGVPSVALGFAAGFTGEVILEEIRSLGIAEDFIHVGGFSRINVKLIQEGRETEINGRGPYVSPGAVAQLLGKVRALPAHSLLVLAGSVPDSLPRNFYAQLLADAARPDLRVAVDAEGELLSSALACGPWVIKPNIHELSALFGARPRTRCEVFDRARELCARGAQNVIVSLGAEGALMAAQAGGELYVPAFRGKAVDTVGAGDSLLAGFIAAKEGGATDAEALRFGVAAGSATSFRKGLATKNEVLDLLKN